MASCGPYAWAWEVKSVNGKGLDLRLRLPPGWDAIEVPVRARAAETLARGSIQANLTVDRTGVTPVVRINMAVLDAVRGRGAATGIAHRGVAAVARRPACAQGRDGDRGSGGGRGGAA